MSPFLVEFTRAIGEALSGAEVRTQKRVSKAITETLQPILGRLNALEKSIGAFKGEQDEFNKSYAEAIVGIGQHVTGVAEVANQYASMPTGAPKSQLRAIQGGVQAVQKSFGPGGLDVGTDALNKSQISSCMIDLVQKGQLNSLDVVKFETTGQLSPAVQQKVMAHIGGAA
jgi:hypothetical protein